MTNSAWAKPGGAHTKSGGAPTNAPAPSSYSSEKRRTLADIQREEEARKLKAKELVTQASMASGSGMGKRYADLASKGQQPATTNHAAGSGPGAPLGGGGWATVGAGGKVKIPTGTCRR